MFQSQEFVEITLLPDELRFGATIRHSDGQHLLLAVDAGEAALFKPGASLQLTQPVGDGLYMCDSSVVNRRDNLIVAKMGRPQLLQRRRSKRFECDLPARYQEGLLLADLLKTDEDSMAAGSIRDISMGGAKLYTAEVLCAKMTLGIYVQLNDKERIGIEGSVVRCTQADASTQSPPGALSYSIAVRFLSVPRIDQVYLHRFLLLFSE